MSDADLMLYPDDNGNNHYETPNLECVLQGYTEVGEVPVDSTVIYYWQYPTPAFQSSETSNVDQTFLDTKLFNTIANFEQGILIPYTSIGRIGFAIKPATVEQYRIYDILDQDITDVVFDKEYNNSLNTTIYVSKEYYSYSNMLFTIKKV